MVSDITEFTNCPIFSLLYQPLKASLDVLFNIVSNKCELNMIARIDYGQLGLRKELNMIARIDYGQLGLRKELNMIPRIDYGQLCLMVSDITEFTNCPIFSLLYQPLKASLDVLFNIVSNKC
jgi:hypothetical protein